MDKLTKDECEALEALIDAHSLSQVVEALQDICYGKAEHLRSNWQDNTAERSWKRDAVNLSRAFQRIEN